MARDCCRLLLKVFIVNVLSNETNIAGNMLKYDEYKKVWNKTLNLGKLSNDTNIWAMCICDRVSC